ncbi:unnamed protein product [Heligmosomoides polygyrus]|uniref:ANF_receptor domain-containing protein n=1 Tax=Heligmosomoides polygyrus TaxID=6339 RepID=A0A183GN23_HELPZ|nr:unnamed protein product [Heligmosomoides polygyrus]
MTCFRLAQSGHFEELGYSVAQLLQDFNWNNLSIMFTSNEVDYCDGIVADLEFALNDAQSYNPDIVYKQEINSQSADPFLEALNEIRSRSRIVLLCLDSSKDRRKFLIRISQLGMISDDFLYIFIGMRGFGFGQPASGKDILENGFTPMWIDVAGNNADGMDDVAMEAAMRVLVVSCYGNLLMCDLEGRRCHFCLISSPEAVPFCAIFGPPKAQFCDPRLQGHIGRVENLWAKLMGLPC